MKKRIIEIYNKYTKKIRFKLKNIYKKTLYRANYDSQYFTKLIVANLLLIAVLIFIYVNI